MNLLSIYTIVNKSICSISFVINDIEELIRDCSNLFECSEITYIVSNGIIAAFFVGYFAFICNLYKRQKIKKWIEVLLIILGVFAIINLIFLWMFFISFSGAMEMKAAETL